MGLCYALLDEDEDRWEIGGLTVSQPMQRLGIGTFLVRLAIAHTIAYQSPIQSRQPIVAHVHEANDDPRKLLSRLGFVFSKPVEIPGASAPSSMKRNAAGNVVGDEFALTSDGLCTVAKWLDEFTGTVRADGASAKIDFGQHRLDDVRIALRSIASEFADCDKQRPQ